MAGSMKTNIGTNGRVVYVSTVYSEKPLVKGDKLYTTPPAAQPASVQGPSEGCPSNWAKVVMMVSPKGEMHAVGGDREPGHGDMPYVGLERIKSCKSKVHCSWQLQDGEVIVRVKNGQIVESAEPPAAQRQWVGLTDEEVMQTMSGDWTSQFYFARAIEAKLKEKNNG
jgi:hypothetical protein